jgi:SAM-dependent methyltransferase
VSKYSKLAGGFSARSYADPSGYFRYRADLIVALGPRLVPGDVVLDLACGDGGLAIPLRSHGVGYLGVDSTPEMVEEARTQGVDAVLGDLNVFTPTTPVAATTCFRAVYYADDRQEFFAHVASYTTKKLVFDLNPRQFPPRLVLSELHAAGWERVQLHPFFHPQQRRLPRPLQALLHGAERSGLLARLLLRLRFSYICVATRD